MKNIKILSGRLCLVTLIGFMSFTTACSSKKTTLQSTTEVRSEPEHSSSDHYHEDQIRDRQTVEVTKKEEVIEEDNHKGIFGIIGDIIALPFRAIASIL
jgi:hypothetical protein